MLSLYIGKGISIFMEKILIKNGRVVDPANYIDGKKDILIEDGKIKKVADFIVEDEDTNVIDADEKAVMPGFIDLHVHLREPGFEYKETIETGSKAAARGGVTSICPMPNTKPVIDSPESVKDLLKRADCSPVHILPIGACTIGQEGKELAEIFFRLRLDHPAIFYVSSFTYRFFDQADYVMDSALFRKLLKEAARLDLPMFSHCEDKALVEGGVMNKGKKSEELGLPGITNSVEDVIVARDIIMSKEAGNRLHLCHCSTADSVVLVEMAKKQGLPVSAEVCPHHFTMSDDEITEDNGRFKMNPPLRNRADVDALKEGLKTGIMEVISTDHAPHGKEEKDQSMLKAPFGIVGLETSFALGYTELVDKGVLTLSQLVEKMSVNPAKVLGIDKGNLAPGKAADIVIADITKEYKIDSSKFVSKTN